MEANRLGSLREWGSLLSTPDPAGRSSDSTSQRPLGPALRGSQALSLAKGTPVADQLGEGPAPRGSRTRHPACLTTPGEAATAAAVLRSGRAQSRRAGSCGFRGRDSWSPTAHTPQTQPLVQDQGRPVQGLDVGRAELLSWASLGESSGSIST